MKVKKKMDYFNFFLNACSSMFYVDCELKAWKKKFRVEFFFENSFYKKQTTFFSLYNFIRTPYPFGPPHATNIIGITPRQTDNDYLANEMVH